MNKLTHINSNKGRETPLTFHEQKIRSLRARVAIPFLTNLLINAILYWLGGVYLGLQISLGLMVVLVGVPPLLYTFGFGRHKHSVLFFLPFYAILLITICVTVGIHSNIHFGFMILIYTSFVFMRNEKERMISFIIGMVGIFFCLYVFHFTTPLIPYPYPFLGSLSNSFTVAIILYIITMHHRDVKDRQEENLRDNQEFHQSIIQGAMDAVIIFDDKLEIVQWNKQATAIFGYEPQDILGKNWVELLTNKNHLKYPKAIQSNNRQEINKWLNQRMDVIGIRQSSEKFPLETTIIATPYKGKSLFTAFLRDVTHKKEAEVNLQEMNMELQQFASMASHDMKEPLRTISSFSKLLERKVKDRPATHEYLYFIQDAAKRMNTLLEDLIAYARAGKETQVTQPVNLNNVLIFVKNNLHDLILRKSAIIEADELPTVEGHQTPYLQLLQNIISNGIKYQSENAQPHIEIRYHEKRTKHIISIHDNGIGMSEEYLGKIFEPFTRLHSRQTYEGTGIGLAICRRIVLRYGGQLKVTSELGTGTTFYIEIPRSNALANPIPKGILIEN
ncbi:MAG: ATP-binding protein [Saprospiraceae bacterium]